MSGLDRFFQAYLVAYTFWMGLVLGSLALLMVQHLSGGAWGVVLRRPFEAAVRTLPYMAVLFIPIALGMHSIYEWSLPEAANDPIIQKKALYLNTNFFLARQVFYFVVWGTIGHLLTTWSAEHDRTGDPALLERFDPIRRRPDDLRLHRDIRGDRLDDVGQSALVLDDLGMLYAVGQALSASHSGSCVLVMLSQAPPLDKVSPSTTSTTSANCCSPS